MLTGDENIVDVDFVVFWRIKDAQAYPLQHPEPRVTVKEVAESAMREIVGQTNIQPILTEAAPEDRAGRAEADAGRARLLRRRHPHRPGAAAEGRSADPGDRRLPRRAGRARRPGAPAERGVRLRQPRRAGGARRGRAHPAGRQGYKEQTVAEATGRGRASSRSTRNTRRRPRSRASACISRPWSACSAAPTRSSSTARAGRASCPSCRSTSCKEARREEGQLMIAEPSPAASWSFVGACRRRRLFRPVHRAVRTSRRSCSSSASRCASSPSRGCTGRSRSCRPSTIFDKRILDLDTAPQEVTASDQKRLVVDAFARYRIIDPLLFYPIRARRAHACARGSARSSSRRCAACSAARPSRTSCATSARR